jgi:hypothetical protein
MFLGIVSTVKQGTHIRIKENTMAGVRCYEELANDP